MRWTEDGWLRMDTGEDRLSGSDCEKVSECMGGRSNTLRRNQPENLARMSKKLPLFLVSGEDDPVGGFGKGVLRVYHTYEELGLLDITWKLYETDRHEILNELDRQQVYEDIYHWIEVRRLT